MSSWPAEFEYLQPIAMRFGKYYELHQIRAFIEGLSSEDRAAIQICFDEFSARQDDEAFSNWIASTRTSAWDESPLGDAFRLMLLFDVIGLLARFKLEPTIISSPAATPKFDWSSLPKELRYLIGPAQRYGRADSVEAQTELMHWLRQEEKNKLLQVAVGIRENNHAPIIERWIQTHDPRLFPESIPIRSFYELLRRIVADRPE